MKRLVSVAFVAVLITLTSTATDFKSNLVRTYVSPCRIVLTEGAVEGAEKMVSTPLSNQEYGQSVLSAGHVMKMNGGSSVIFDFGKELHGGLRITTVSFPKDGKVRIRFGESVSETCSEIGQDGATNDHAMRDFEMTLPMYGVKETSNSGFRFVRIDMLGEDVSTTIRCVQAVKIDSPYELKGSFRSSDPRLDSIWETGRHTVKLNMQDYLWDGIKRDRLVWIGDMYPEVMTICSTYGDVDIVPRSLDFATADHPLPTWINGISSYSMWWILIQYQWYLHTGDVEYLRGQNDYLFGLLKQLYSNIGEDNREHIEGRRFLDWPSNADDNATATGMHALMLIAFDYGEKLSSILNNESMVKLCQDGYKRLQSKNQEVKEEFFAKKIAADQVGRKQAVALMLLAGMMSSEEAAGQLLYNGPHGFSTFYGYYMLEALAKAGKYEEAMSIIKDYWGGMLDLGATSFWEDFDIDWLKNAGRIDELPVEGKVDVHRTYGGYCYKGLRHSFCHGWASGPTSWMTRHVLGLRPLNAGQDSVSVDPHLGSLKWAEGKYPTPKGIVTIKLNRTPDGKTLARVDAPEGVVLVPSNGVVLRQEKLGDDNIDYIADRFTVVPRREIKTGVYWYWINDNVTEEGVIKDLEAMKSVGIDRVQVGNIQSGNVPSGDALFLSDKWWNITRAAMKKAAELGIDFGEFNSPGWSQSGGPWVSPSQAMRYVAFKDTVIKGDGTVHEISMPDVQKDQIISTYAYRKIQGRTERFYVTADSVIELPLNKAITLRSLSLQSKKPLSCKVTLLADGKPIKQIEFDRGNHALNVGFYPDAPVVENIPEVTSSNFKLVLDKKQNVQMEVILSENVRVERFAEKSLAKMCPYPLPMWDYYMWEKPYDFSAIPGAITDIVRIDSSKWLVPEGEWTISTAYMTPTGVKNSPATPEATGLEVDKMSRRYIRYHFDKYLGEMLRRIPANDRGTFTLSIMDSYEMGGQNWTDDMRSHFISAYGYDPLPYLPTLQGYVVETPEKSERFLWDIRRLVADLVANEYVAGLSEVCHENGLQSWLECYGHWGFPGEFLLYGGKSDQIAGEFWNEGTLGDIENRAASSCGHTYGKNVIWAESCTASGPQYHRTPRMMKPRIDRFFTEGINNTLFHLYIAQPDDRVPGLDAWFGNEYNRGNTWFSSMGMFIDYVKRCNYMLQQGRYVAQVAYFIGEDAPKMTGCCDPEMPAGYSFDYINADILQNHAHVSNGKLILDSGMEYNLLVLPNQKTMRPEMAECIAKLVRQGLVVTGPKPLSSPSLKNWPQADMKLSSIADSLWDGGLVIPYGTPLKNILDSLNIKPDFTYVKATEDTSKLDVRFIHRTLPDEAEIYFLSNQKDEKSDFYAKFNTDMQPQLWNPVTGQISQSSLDDKNGMHIILDSLESVFVVFRKDVTGTPVAAPATCKDVKFGKQWTAVFHESAGNASFTQTCDYPSDWTLSQDERIRYFSGTADYSNTFNISKKDLSGSKVTLDLGKVVVLCKVKINGKEVGGMWTAPYTLSIGDYLNEGVNTIEIQVTNNWQNRLMADSHLPAEKRGTWTNINPYENSDYQLQPSGILGKIRIYVEK